MGEAVALAFLLLTLVCLVLHLLRMKAKRSGLLRPVAGFQRLADLISRSAETGQPLHVSVGVAGVGGAATAETCAGLTLLGQLAEEAAAHGIPLLVTVSDATVLPIAQDILYSAHARYGHPEWARPEYVRLIAPDPMAYAAGTMGLLAREPLAGNVMVGSFGDEYLLMGETGARRGLHQVVGTTEPRTLSLVRLSADDMLVGEEVFAGGAYTTGLPIQVASLLTEDWLRWVVIGGILLAAIWKLVA